MKNTSLETNLLNEIVHFMGHPEARFRIRGIFTNEEFPRARVILEDLSPAQYGSLSEACLKDYVKDYVVCDKSDY